MADDSPQFEQPHKVDRLLDAIELIKDNQREQAVPLLRSIIREDANFEDAWLWMSIAVDEIDQSIICLDNVLRINPDNLDASTALYRLRQEELLAERQRAHYRRVRDSASIVLWIIIGLVLFFLLVSFGAELTTIDPTALSTPTLSPR